MVEADADSVFRGASQESAASAYQHSGAGRRMLQHSSTAAAHDGHSVPLEASAVSSALRLMPHCATVASHEDSELREASGRRIEAPGPDSWHSGFCGLLSPHPDSKGVVAWVHFEGGEGARKLVLRRGPVTLASFALDTLLISRHPNTHGTVKAHILKGQYVVAVFSKYTRALTSENFCQALPPQLRGLLYLPQTRERQQARGICGSTRRRAPARGRRACQRAH